MTPRRLLWVCPECGNRFVTPNMWHSCVRLTLADHFRGKSPARKATFDRWLRAARACGPVRVIPQKTRIAFQVRVRFGGAVIRASYVDGTLWLTRRVKHSTLRRTEVYGPRSFGHHFRLERPADVDPALEALVREAYAVGRQEHLPGGG